MTLERLACDYLLLEKHWPDIKPKRTEKIKWGQQILLISDEMEGREEEFFLQDISDQMPPSEASKKRNMSQATARREREKLLTLTKYGEVHYTFHVMADDNISYLKCKQTPSCSHEKTRSIF